MSSLVAPKAKLNKTDLLLDSILQSLSPLQRAFLLDPSRFRLARCSRRAGKTVCLAALMVYTAIKNPKSPIVYFGLTRDSAKEAVLEPIRDLLTALSIDAVVSDAQLTIDFANGSKIRLYGIDMAGIADRFRGRKFRLICIDEVAFFKSLDTIVANVFLPTLADYAGPLVMASSPGVMAQGLFYEADVGKAKSQWSHHSWSMRDNPLFQAAAIDPAYPNRAEEELAIVCAMKFGGDRTSPAFRREYEGEWVFDKASLIFPLQPSNVVQHMPRIRTLEHTVGVNLSAAGKQGFVVLAHSDYTASSYVVEAFTARHKTLDTLALEVNRLIDRYSAIRAVAHLGKLPPTALDDFASRYDSSLTASEYPKSGFAQTIVATDMLNGHVNVLQSCTQLIDELSKLVQDENGIEVPEQENTLADAFFVASVNVITSRPKQLPENEPEDERMLRQLLETTNKGRDYDDGY